MRVGILCIATGNYKSFVQQLIDGIANNFLIHHEREIYLFTDEERDYPSRLKVIQTIIPPYKWPEASMLRFKMYTSRTYDCDYIFHSDIDMRFVDQVGEEILSDIVAVKHPGFYNNYKGSSKGSWEERPESHCYVPPEKRITYVAGGFNGGKTEVFYKAMEQMRDWIDKDLENGIVPRFHDESAFNKFIAGGIKFLTPSYCMPEAMTKRSKWHIGNLKPIILALEKNFAEIRK